MRNEQEELLHRLQSFNVRQSECLVSCFYTPPQAENFFTTEQIHVHQASGGCKAEYIDIVEFWLNSLFNFLEDRFEDDELASYITRCEWKSVEPEEVFEAASALFRKIQATGELAVESKLVKAFRMLHDAKLTAFVMETKEGYISFFWRAATI